MPTPAASHPLFLGTGTPDAELLARSLLAEPTLACPPVPETSTWRWDWIDTLDDWSREIAALPEVDEVVVCTWTDPVPTLPLVELDAVGWRREVEWPTSLWFSTMVVAAGRCRDGGSLVAVVDRPATLDALGQVPAVTVAEGVENLVRSLAAREGKRGVRVNAVVSARQVDPNGLLGSPPPLATFPGRIDVEIAGAIRLLLSDDAAGITGTAVSATSGRP